MRWAENSVPNIWDKLHGIALVDVLEVGVVDLAALEPVGCSLGFARLQPYDSHTTGVDYDAWTPVNMLPYPGCCCRAVGR